MSKAMSPFQLAGFQIAAGGTVFQSQLRGKSPLPREENKERRRFFNEAHDFSRLVDPFKRSQGDET
jgi:hypothetical protein